MRKSLVAGMLLLLFYSCGQKKSDKSSPTDVLAGIEDSVTLKSDKEMNDTSDVDSFYIEEVEELPQVNEIFDDFIFNFAADEQLQKQRIVFPLSYYNKNIPLKIGANEWKHDSLFLDENYYTVLVDNEDELDVLNDTSVVSAHLDWIYLEENELKRYYFEKINGHWMLEAINLRDMKNDPNNSFIHFYHRFATDSAFQIAHVANPLEFVTSDPDDDFSVLETTLERNQWLAFKPELPQKKLTNIGYGQEEIGQSTSKILQLKGLGNGFINTFYFRLKKGEWKLCKFEDVNN